MRRFEAGFHAQPEKSMTNTQQRREPSAVLCADWGKEFPKRSVYVADVAARAVRRVSGDGWSVARVLDEAERWSSTGWVLTAFDAPLGVPESYLAALSRSWSGPPPLTFLDLLSRARTMPRFFDGTSDARDWSLERPFFSVPAGEGGLRSYVDAAARCGVNMFRRIDRITGAKAVFIKSGVPGSVGSAACALWQELAPWLTASRRFKVWPFEGDLQLLLESSPIVVGEIYPRAAYATALLDVPPASRAPLIVAKTDAGVRREAITSLRAAKWVRWLRVTFENLAEAEANEDDFDACITAAALLRCVLDGSPLCPTQIESAASEGGILGTGSVNLGLRQQAFGRPAAVRLPIDLIQRQVTPRLIGTQGAAIYRCPIAGCEKTFQGSRGGWDGHVGSLRLHPNWHPELQEPAARKRCFEREFPTFFN
jgi:hypothetical protein